MIERNMSRRFWVQRRPAMDGDKLSFYWYSVINHSYCKILHYLNVHTLKFS